MRRAILILFLLVALLNGRHPIIRLPQQPETMALVATPVPLNSRDPGQRQFGELRYLGGWSLTGSSARFGGISSLRVADDGSVSALGDGGEIMTFRSGGPVRSSAHLRLLPILPNERGAQRSGWDTESMTWDRRSGKIWVGFEYRNRICRYSKGFARVERCNAPQAIKHWPPKTGMESLVRLPDGRFVAIAEDSRGPVGIGHDMLVFAGDPAEPETPPPVRMNYLAPRGYLPTDALPIGDDRLLVMNRRLTLADGFTGVLTLVDMASGIEGTLGHSGTGPLVAGRVVARFAAPVLHDNFEALAMSMEGERPILWIASDDNFLFFQRTLLMKFAMPSAWFANGEAGRARDSAKYPKNTRFHGRP